MVRLRVLDGYKLSNFIVLTALAALYLDLLVKLELPGYHKKKCAAAVAFHPVVMILLLGCILQ